MTSQQGINSRAIIAAMLPFIITGALVAGWIWYLVHTGAPLSAGSEILGCK